MAILMKIKDIKQPKVSVIVAAFNQEKYIGRCLRSLLHQSLPHSEYEIIVVDDGSTDSTSYAISLFVDPFNSPVKVISNPVNMGLPSALNTGIKAAKGDYIVRVDSDDFVNADFIKLLMMFLEENKHMDAVACDYFLVDDDENIRSRASCVEKPIACGIMFKKEHLFEIGLYDEDFICQEEREIRLRFEKKYSINHLELPLYRYRRHDNNITNDIKKMDRLHAKLIQKHGIDDSN